MAPDLRNHQKQPKNGSLNRDLLKFLPPGESSCPDGSEYVWQKKICQPAADSILTPPTFPIASLNRYTPKFSGAQC